MAMFCLIFSLNLTGNFLSKFLEHQSSNCHSYAAPEPFSSSYADSSTLNPLISTRQHCDFQENIIFLGNGTSVQGDFLFLDYHLTQDYK